MTKEDAIQKIIDEMSINGICLIFNPHIFGEYLEQLYSIGFDEGYMEKIKRGKSKEVDQYHKDGTYIKTFRNIRTAELITGIAHQHISKVCLGIELSAGGYIWKHKL